MNMVLIPMIYSQSEERQSHDVFNERGFGVAGSIRAEKFNRILGGSVSFYSLFDFAQSKIAVQVNGSLLVSEEKGW